MKKVIYGVAISWIMIFSIRMVAIASPLNIYEQIGLVGIFIDYTLSKSKEL